MIGNFPEKKTYNPGGYGSFAFTLVQNLLRYQKSGNQRSVIFKDSFTWWSGYATRETLALTEEPQFDEGGTCYNTIVAGFIPGDKSVLTSMLADMAKQRYVLTIKDRAGFIRIVGSIKEPLEFVASYNSGAVPTDQKGYSFKFFGLTSSPAPEYSE
jgi:hypothetical protein